MRSDLLIDRVEGGGQLLYLALAHPLCAILSAGQRLVEGRDWVAALAGAAVRMTTEAPAF